MPGREHRSSLEWALAFQLALPSALTLVYPPLVLRLAGKSTSETAGVLAFTLLALALATIFQSLRRGPIGSGSLLPSLSSGLHLAPAMLAVQAGGMALVAGMTIFAGLAEIVISMFLRRLRILFPQAIIGLILVLVGVEIARAGVHAIWNEISAPSHTSWQILTVAGAALGALTLSWNSRNVLVRTIGPLGVYVAAILVGRWLLGSGASGEELPWLGIPALSNDGWAFQWSFAAYYLAVALASAVRALGGVEGLHSAMRHSGEPRIEGGVRADGVGTIMCGLAGSIGSCVALNSIPAEKAAGIDSPRVAWMVGLLLGILAFCPALMAYIADSPGFASGPLLVYYGTVMALPCLASLSAARKSPWFVWQVGVPTILVLAAIVHKYWPLQGNAAFAPLVDFLSNSLLTIGIFSALLIRLGIIGISKFQNTP